MLLPSVPPRRCPAKPPPCWLTSTPACPPGWPLLPKALPHSPPTHHHVPQSCGSNDPLSEASRTLRLPHHRIPWIPTPPQADHVVSEQPDSHANEDGSSTVSICDSTQHKACLALSRGLGGAGGVSLLSGLPAATIPACRGALALPSQMLTPLQQTLPQEAFCGSSYLPSWCPSQC